MSNNDDTNVLLKSVESADSCQKPTLIRQDCTTYLATMHRPQLSVFSNSEEDGVSGYLDDQNDRSVPDIEMQCRSVLFNKNQRLQPVNRNRKNVDNQPVM